MKQRIHFLKRTVLFLIGLFVMAVGVVLSVKADLGTSPVSCVPYIYSLRFPLTIGQFTILVNLILIVLQVVLLRRRYQWIQLIQLPVSLLFGVFIDVCMALMSGLEPSGYLLKACLCLLSCAVLAFGVFLEVKARLTYLAGEGLAMAVSQVFGREFGKAKVLIDSLLVIIGLISSLVFVSRITGIREGTVLAALLVGFMARFFSSRLTFVDRWLGDIQTPVPVRSPVLPNGQNLIITIAREFGSGGHEIGQAVARRLGLAFYDTRLIDLTAAESGLTPEYVQANEQKLANRLLFELFEQNYAYVSDELPPQDVLFMVQSKVIRDLAARESCVIVGRAADFVLKAHPDCLTVFIHADPAFRSKRIMQEFGYDPHEAQKAMEHRDRERMNYCRHYTHKIWGRPSNYDLIIDSSRFGIDCSVALICDAVEQRWNHSMASVA